MREPYLQEGIKEYRKRLEPYVRLELIEVADEPGPDRLAPAEEARVKEREGERLLRGISERDYVILLDIQGQEMGSARFAGMLADLAEQGKNNLVMVIGGSLGVADRVRKRADFKWSFSRLTFPHPLMRLVLLEQVYRTMSQQSESEPAQG